MDKDLEKELMMFDDVLGVKAPVISSSYTKEEVFDYNLNRVSIGMIPKTLRPLSLSFKASKRSLLIGTTGSGKSWLIRTFFNRFVKSGGFTLIIDLKGEYLNSTEPLQHKFLKFLLPKEKPEGILEMKAYYPRFFEKYFTRDLEDIEQYCQFGVRSLNKFDFLTLLENHTENERLLLEEAYTKIPADIQSVEELKEYITKVKGFPQPTKKSLLKKIENLESDGVIGDEYEPPNIPQDFMNGTKVVVLNLKGIMKFGDFNERAAAYIAVLLRQIYSAKIEGMLPKKFHVMIWLDEVHRWCPSEKDRRNPSSKAEILNLLRLSRSELMSLGFSAQERKDIHDLLFSQCDDIFLSHTVGFAKFKDMLKEKLPGEYESPYDFGPMISDIMRDMKERKDGSRDWLYIDGKSKNYYVFRPLAPLTEVMEEVD